MQYLLITRTTRVGVSTKHNIDHSEIDDILFNLWRRYSDTNMDYCIVNQPVKHRCNEATCQICASYISKADQLPMVKIYDKFKDRQLFSLWIRSKDEQPALIMINSTIPVVYEYVKGSIWPNYEFQVELQTDIISDIKGLVPPTDQWTTYERFLELAEKRN